MVGMDTGPVGPEMPDSEADIPIEQVVGVHLAPGSPERTGAEGRNAQRAVRQPARPAPPAWREARAELNALPLADEMWAGAVLTRRKIPGCLTEDPPDWRCWRQLRASLNS